MARPREAADSEMPEADVHGVGITVLWSVTPLSACCVDRSPVVLPSPWRFLRWRQLLTLAPSCGSAGRPSTLFVCFIEFLLCVYKVACIFRAHFQRRSARKCLKEKCSKAHYILKTLTYRQEGNTITVLFKSIIKSMLST